MPTKAGSVSGGGTRGGGEEEGEEGEEAQSDGDASLMVRLHRPGSTLLDGMYFDGSRSISCQYPSRVSAFPSEVLWPVRPGRGGPMLERRASPR